MTNDLLAPSRYELGRLCNKQDVLAYEVTHEHETHGNLATSSTNVLFIVNLACCTGQCYCSYLPTSVLSTMDCRCHPITTIRLPRHEFCPATGRDSIVLDARVGWAYFRTCWDNESGGPRPICKVPYCRWWLV